GQSTENTTDTTNQVTDSKPDTPANTPAPEPSEPPASETSVVEPDAVADLKPHVSDPETPVAKPGVVSATEIEVRAKPTQSAKPSHPTKPTQSAKPAIPAEPARPATQPTSKPAIPAEPAQPAIPAEPPAVAEVVVPQPTVAAEPWSEPVVAMVSALEAKVEVPETATKVVSNVLAAVGLNPFVSRDPAKPVPDSPVTWAMLAMARKREDVPEPSSFGRMFGDLAPLNQQTTEELKAIACGACAVGGTGQGMLEPATINNPKGTTAGITFFGQFIDHDLTLDTLPQPDSSVDPTTLVNGRTFAFDLDSVYGGGPSKSPQLYNGDKFKLGVATDGVTPDLPRDPITHQAILVEHRNDENLIIAQIHLSFLRLHNELIDQGMSFDEAHGT